jgi:methylmalonyl-CoA epimerase
MFERIDHVGIAVHDLDEALEIYDKRFAMQLVHREAIDEQGVEAALLDVGDGHVELLSPTAPDTPIGRFLASRGAGMHHLAYAVADIDATLADLRDRAFTLIDDVPRAGIRSSRVAFLDPRSCGGVLTEIVEPAR